MAVIEAVLHRDDIFLKHFALYLLQKKMSSLSDLPLNKLSLKTILFFTTYFLP